MDEKLYEQLSELLDRLDKSRKMTEAKTIEDFDAINQERLEVIKLFIKEKGDDAHQWVVDQYNEALKDGLNMGSTVFSANAGKKIIELVNIKLGQLDQEIELKEMLKPLTFPYDSKKEEIATDFDLYVKRRQFEYDSSTSEKITQEELDSLDKLAKAYGAELSISNVKGGEDKIEIKKNNEVISTFNIEFDNDEVALKR